MSKTVLRLLVVLALAAGLLPAAGAVAATDAQAPSAAVNVPEQGQVFTQGPVALAGTATDDTGVTGATVAIQDLDSTLWLQADGSFGPWRSRLRDADLGSPNATSTTWTYSFDPGRNGTFGAQVQASDAAGNLSTKTWRKFTLADSPPPPGQDAQAPSAAVNVPEQGQVFTQGPVALAGTATDDTGVTGATVAIQDLDSTLWLQADGSFGPWRSRLRDADLGSPNATSTTWTYSFDPGRNGTFGAQVQASDAAGNLSTKTWRKFTVEGLQPPPATPGYVTLLFGRALWVQTDLDCQPKPGTVDLQGVADALQSRGLSASGNAVVSRTNETTRRCWSKYALHPSWQDLARLRDDYGWSFVSGGAKYRNITTLSPEEQFAESCGSLDAFLAHGHTRASGLFAYPNNKTTSQIQSDVVSGCFSFGRKYGSGVTQSPPQSPYFQSTHSVNGGKCNDASLPCYTLAVRNDRRYASPEDLIAKASVDPGQWATLQWYRMVTGTVQDGSNFQWDCRSSDWRQHWTSDPETYCFEDFLAVVDALPSDVVVTDPLAVAQAWGRVG